MSLEGGLREYTRKETLLECLDLMRRFRRCFSHKEMGMEPIPRYKSLFEEYDRKCRILMELAQAMDFDPVKKALADFHRDYDEEDYTGNNGPLGRA